MNIGFHPDSAWWLLLLLLVPLGWFRWGSRRRPTIGFSSISPLLQCGRTWVVRTRPVLPVLRMLGLAMLIICMARPIRANQQTRIAVEGIAIQMLVDRSSSMQAMDFAIDGVPVNRLAAVKDVATEFVAGGDGLEGRPDDLIGLISFAQYADSICPLTLDHGHLLLALDQVKLAMDRSEDGTAIGDAVALAVERLRDADERLEGEARNRIKSKIIILLTDGENTAGDIDPIIASELAAEYGIRIYTIGVGTRGYAKVPVQRFGRIVYQDVPVTIDEETLEAMAETTGGRYFRATDSDSLVKVYETIDQLEKTETEQRRFVTYRDLAVDSFDLAGFRLPPLLVIALLLISLELLLSSTTYRSIP
ncbi:MAG: aerotolerance regulator BatA [Phycisphaerae bacterium]|nr:aerotolerance regulator BatA [Phycisphaerae bacterium]